MRAVYKEAQRDETVLDVRVEEPTNIFSALRQAVELDMLAQHDLLHPLRSSTPPWLYIQVLLPGPSLHYRLLTLCPAAY